MPDARNDAGQKKARKIPSKKNPPWWPTAEQKRHADAGCGHPDVCRVLPPDPTKAEQCPPNSPRPCRRCVRG